MPCYHPLPGWLSKSRNASGKRSVVFNVSEGFKDKQVQVPCGRCIGCRLEYARRWAIRCVHESKLYEQNCFVTLTYDPDRIPENGSLRPRDFVLFMKRLRKQYGPGIRFFQCGEYGEQLSRPHHHALLFNHNFSDRRAKPGAGMQLYTSRELQALWPYGFSSIGNVTFDSAGYVARYSVKKINGAGAEAHYGGRKPEYCTMSRRPGIGRGFYDKYSSDMYPDGEVVLRGGVRMGTPRYYDEVHESKNPVDMYRLRVARNKELREDVDATGPRLIVREAVAESRISMLTERSFEECHG